MPYLASDEKRVIGGSSALKSQMFLAHDAISPFSGMSRGSILLLAAFAYKMFLEI